MVFAAPPSKLLACSGENRGKPHLVQASKLGQSPALIDGVQLHKSHQTEISSFPIVKILSSPWLRTRG
jgi:hypothetical protein